MIGTANIKHVVDKDEAGLRLDLFLLKNYPDRSRSSLAKIVKDGLVQVNSNIAKTGYKVHLGDKITLFDRDERQHMPAPESIPLNIIYEDSDVIVLNKPAGMIVHPVTGDEKGTLVSALLNHYPKIKEAVVDETSSVSSLRAGIVHRLDKDTSGVIIVAKNKKSMEFLSKEIKSRRVKKIYWALCVGWPERQKGELVNHIGRHKTNRAQMTEIGEVMGRKAISRYNVIKYFKDKTGERFSLIEFDIETGRTHQIRLQSKIMKHPVVGDPVYSTKESVHSSRELLAKRQLLHAKQLTIQLPESKIIKTFEADIPADFKMVLSRLTEIK